MYYLPSTEQKKKINYPNSRYSVAAASVSDILKEEKEELEKTKLTKIYVKFQTKYFNVTKYIIGRNVNFSLCIVLMHIWNGGKFHTFLTHLGRDI